MSLNDSETEGRQPSLKCLRGYLANDFLAQLRRKLIEASSKHIETDSRIEKGYFGTHVLSDTGRGVQSNRRPCNLYLFFRDLMCREKLTGGVCAIDLESFVWAREFLNETEIVKSGRAT